jgi:hypothetical protein
MLTREEKKVAVCVAAAVAGVLAMNVVLEAVTMSICMDSRYGAQGEGPGPAGAGPVAGGAWRPAAAAVAFGPWQQIFRFP